MNRKRGGSDMETVTFSQKWGDDPFTALGHTQVPNALVLYRERLGMSDSECWLIATILMFKHTSANPYPTQARLAELLGKEDRSVRRLIAQLEDKGLVVTVRGRLDSGHYDHLEYDLAPLRARLNDCYYADHPEARPKGWTTGQNCPMVDQRTNSSKPADNSVQTSGLASGQKSPLKRSTKDSGKEIKKTGGVAAPVPDEEMPMSAAERRLMIDDSPFAREWRRKRGIKE